MKKYKVTIETDEIETYHNVLAHVRTDRMLMLDLGNALYYFNLDYVRSYRVWHEESEEVTPSTTKQHSSPVVLQVRV